MSFFAALYTNRQSPDIQAYSVRGCLWRRESRLEPTHHSKIWVKINWTTNKVHICTQSRELWRRIESETCLNGASYSKRIRSRMRCPNRLLHSAWGKKKWLVIFKGELFNFRKGVLPVHFSHGTRCSSSLTFRAKQRFLTFHQCSYSYSICSIHPKVLQICMYKTGLISAQNLHEQCTVNFNVK